MRKAFAALDDALIERLFQPASDLIRYRVDVSRETAACFCVDMASLAWIASRLPKLSIAVTTWDASAGFADMALLLLGMVALVGLRIVFRRPTTAQRNPLRSAMRPHRGIALAMLAADLTQPGVPRLANMADIATLVFAAAALYLGACSQRPPVRLDLPAFAGGSAR
ncbi:hypothetical protein [Rhodopila sp.]|uniref:hypothetical protein n=1 Tax=Rhodopila sp. TaxID=2480087 RepID=UPI003D11E355